MPLPSEPSTSNMEDDEGDIYAPDEDEKQTGAKDEPDVKDEEMKDGDESEEEDDEDDSASVGSFTT